MYKPLVVRLAKKGDKKHRVYRLIVTSRDPTRRGGEVTCLGFINPAAGEWQIAVDCQRLALWLNRGALVNSRAAKLIGLIASLVSSIK